MPEPVVVDTNVLFSALLRTSSSFAQQILASGHDFFVCEAVIVELFRHKERIVQMSRLSEEEVVRFFYLLLRRLDLFKEDLIAPSAREEAWRLCQEVDEADTPHVALTLHLGGRLWTGDERLKRGLRERGFDRFFDPHA